MIWERLPAELLRSLMYSFAGFLVTKGIIGESMIEPIVGGMTWLGTMLFDVVRKRRD